ncbi:BRO-N domain-containing protein [Lelliottia amnigena]|uniref:BRO-N domain-containing protein n=1 Tax=Lelliottia amnigena TaxID=61646 RepID=UPI0040576686
MNNHLMTFNSKDLGISLSGMLYCGKPVFDAVELAKSLGYANPADALKTHCKSLIKLNYSESRELGFQDKIRGMQLAPESDAYRLILRSQLPSAERVQDWVCEDVLPSIRETGGYGYQRPKSQAEIIAEMALLNVEQERRLNHVEDKVEEVSETIENIKRGSVPAGWSGYSVLKIKSGMTPPKCKTLVKAYGVPTDTITMLTPDGQPRPMAVVLDAEFIAAFRQMMSEAEPRGTRWYHPKMGLFQAIGWEG